MPIFHKYLYKEITVHVLLVMLALMAMFSFFDLIQELDSLGKGHYGLANILLFVLLSVPGHVYDVVPVAVLVGCMMSLSQLARHSELLVLRVSGLSVFKLGLILVQIGLLFTLLTFSVGELLTPISEKMAQRLRIQASHAVVAQEFRSGLWVKDDRQFINVEEVMADTTLVNVHIYEFDQQARLIRMRDAKSADYQQDHWRLKDVTETQFKLEQNSVTQLAEAKWHSMIRPALLNVLLVMPEKMSAWNLSAYIDHLNNNKQKTNRYQVALWAKMVYPLACLVMVILALPFALLPQRTSGVSAQALLGIMLGVAYQILNRVFAHLGLLNDWPPLLSALLPTLLFLLAGLVMLRLVAQR
jgi:lipopolysaccharide export system permease protein